MSAIELAVNSRNVVESGMDHAGSRRSIRCYEGFGLNLRIYRAYGFGRLHGAMMVALVTK